MQRREKGARSEYRVVVRSGCAACRSRQTKHACAQQPIDAGPVVLAFNTDTGDASGDATALQIAPASAAVVPFVGMELVRPLARTSIQPANRRDGVQGGFERDRIVPVRAGHRDGQWNTLGIYDKVSFAAELASVSRVRAGFLAPPGAGHACPVDAGPPPIDLVMLAQAAKHRHMQLVPYPSGLPVAQPSPASHATAETKLLGQVLPRDTGLQHEQEPFNAARSSTRGRPPLVEGSTTGSSGCNAFHSSLLIFFRAMPTTTVNNLRSMTWFC